jgi:hypothetical protein
MSSFENCLLGSPPHLLIGPIMIEEDNLKDVCIVQLKVAT